MLKRRWKIDTERQRLRSFVIGGKWASKQDLRSQLGIILSAQKELDDERIRDLTSSATVGKKLERIGGTRSGAMCRDERDEDIVERSLVILSEKTLRKAEGRSEREIEEGSFGSEERLRRLFKETLSFGGLLILAEIWVPKNSFLAEEINLERSLDCCLKLKRSEVYLILP